MIKKVILWLSFVMLGQTVVLSMHAFAATCSDVEIVFARGSGQTVGEDRAEAKIFANNLSTHLGKAEISVSFHELTADEYPAVAIGQKHAPTTVGAVLSGGELFAYGKSVDAGARSLKNHVVQRNFDCPNMYFVLGGFSQGAQVVGEALKQLESTTAKDKIVFNALFGDPKLNLPEGQRKKTGLFSYEPAPACSGDLLSPWRRNPIDCTTHRGSLGARENYLPSFAHDKTGLWCISGDIVCNNSGGFDAHGKYKDAGSSIDKAVSEALQRISKKIAEQPDQPAEKSEMLIEAADKSVVRELKTDVAFLFDLDDPEGRVTLEAIEYLRANSEKMDQLGGRVAIVSYSSNCDGSSDAENIDFTDNLESIRQRLEARGDAMACVSPSNLHDGLMVALEKLSWRKDARKVILVSSNAAMGRADFSIHEMADHAFEFGSIGINFLRWHSTLESDFRQLVQLTASTVFYGHTIESRLEKALSSFIDGPVAAVSLSKYTGFKDTVIKFDVSDSWIKDPWKIVYYMWDFEGDGRIDSYTEQPVNTWAYGEVFDGQMRVHTISTNGVSEWASAAVRIYDSADQLPALPVTAREAKFLLNEAGDKVEVSWQSTEQSGTLRQASGAQAAKWQVNMNGMPLAEITEDSTELRLTIAGLERDKDIDISITAVSDEGVYGDPVSLIIKKDDVAEQPIDPEDVGGASCGKSFTRGNSFHWCEYKQIKNKGTNKTVVVWNAQPLHK